MGRTAYIPNSSDRTDPREFPVRSARRHTNAETTVAKSWRTWACAEILSDDQRRGKRRLKAVRSTVGFGTSFETEKEMNGTAIEAYEQTYKTAWNDAPRHCQKMWLDAWRAALGQAIDVVETYRVSVGNSAAGELAAKWTMDNLREVRSEIRDMVPNADVTGLAPAQEIDK